MRFIIYKNSHRFHANIVCIADLTLLQFDAAVMHKLRKSRR